MKWDERELEIFGGITIRQQVQEFSAVFAVTFVILADVYIYYFGHTQTTILILAVTGLLLILGLQNPRLIYPFWRLWIVFVELLIKALTWITLLLLWIFVVSPVSIIRKYLKISKLNLDYSREIESYWQAKSKRDNDFSLMKRGY